MVPTIHNQISANNRKTLLLMAVFTAFILVVSYVLTRALGYTNSGALTFVGVFLIISGFINLASYYWSDKLVIALSGAVRIEKKDNPELFRIVENLAIADGIPMPKVYIMEDPAPNAFATGRDPNHAAVAATTGLLGSLEKLELEGVIAHELSHIKNRDSRLMSIVVILVGLVALLANFFFRAVFWGGRGGNENKGSGALFMVLGLVAAILAPIAANVIKLAISRRREFQADASGALLTRYPEGLAKALVKISQDPSTLKTANSATAHMYIENPFKGKDAKNWLVRLFSTHPPMEERIAALQTMEKP